MRPRRTIFHFVVPQECSCREGDEFAVEFLAPAAGFRRFGSWQIDCQFANRRLSASRVGGYVDFDMDCGAPFASVYWKKFWTLPPSGPPPLGGYACRLAREALACLPLRAVRPRLQKLESSEGASASINGFICACASSSGKFCSTSAKCVSKFSLTFENFGERLGLGFRFPSFPRAPRRLRAAPLNSCTATFSNCAWFSPCSEARARKSAYSCVWRNSLKASRASLALVKPRVAERAVPRHFVLPVFRHIPFFAARLAKCSSRLACGSDIARQPECAGVFVGYHRVRRKCRRRGGRAATLAAATGCHSPPAASSCRPASGESARGAGSHKRKMRSAWQTGLRLVWGCGSLFCSFAADCRGLFAGGSVSPR